MTLRRFMSFTAMAFLWTGSQIPVYLFGTNRVSVNTNFTNSLARRHSPLHLWGHWWSRSLDLVCTKKPSFYPSWLRMLTISQLSGPGQPFESRCRLPLCRIAIRLVRSPISRHCRRVTHLLGHDCQQHRPQHEHFHRYVKSNEKKYTEKKA